MPAMNRLELLLIGGVSKIETRIDLYSCYLGLDRGVSAIRNKDV